MKNINVNVEGHDVPIDIAAPKEAMWLRVKNNLEKNIKQMEQELEVNKAFLKLASENAEIEKLK